MNQTVATRALGWQSEVSAVNRRTGQRGVNMAMNQAVCDIFSASESASERVMNE